MCKVLFVSYDGVLEPLGQSQVLGYVERLARAHDFTLISYEKAADLQDVARVSMLRRRLESNGIKWICLRYHKSPPVLSTMFDILRGIWRARSAVAQDSAIVHARGYVPAVIALVLSR